MKPRRLVVGLTGGIGTGKSSALACFGRLGAATVSLDQIAHSLAKPGRKGYKAIVKYFGTRILKADGSIDRALLGRVVFNDKNARSSLERATHPLILTEAKQLVARMNGVVVVDVPLLFEKKLQKNFDATILIACKQKKQLRRIMKRDGLTLTEARRRVKAQWPLARKRKIVDVAIDNDKAPSYLKQQVRQYHAGFRLLHGGVSHGNAN